MYALALEFAINDEHKVRNQLQGIIVDYCA